MNNIELISAIQKDGISRDLALQAVYNDPKLRLAVIRLIQSNGGNIQDAEDVFQDTLILFDRQIREGNFNGQSAWATYFVGIAKWRWVSVKRKFGRDTELKTEHFEEIVESVEARAIENEKRQIIDEILAKIGEKCKNLLKLYKLSYSMEEIAQLLGLNSPELAKKNAYECRKKFRAYVEENPDYKNFLNV